MTEITHAAEKLSRKDAEPLVKKLINKYKDGQQEMKFGKRFDEVYDLETLEPTQEWLSTYEQVYEEMIDMGLPL